MDTVLRAAAALLRRWRADRSVACLPGIWDVERGEDGVHMLSAHTGHIVGLSFSPTDGSRCYTSSYDGISRCLDLERQHLEQVSSTHPPPPALLDKITVHCSAEYAMGEIHHLRPN